MPTSPFVPVCQLAAENFNQLNFLYKRFQIGNRSRKILVTYFYLSIRSCHAALSLSIRSCRPSGCSRCRPSSSGPDSVSGASCAADAHASDGPAASRVQKELDRAGASSWGEQSCAQVSAGVEIRQAPSDQCLAPRLWVPLLQLNTLQILSFL